MRINYLSDFKVRLQPTVGGEPVDITGHDFRIVFGTSGGTRRYECGKSGDTLTNCTIDGTAIVCVLDNHRLSKGQLCAWVFDYEPDATYPDGNELTVTPSEIDVTLVTGAGDGSDIDAEVAADISAAVHTAQDAAAEAAASADEAGDAAVLARAAQVAAEDAAERAAEVGGYSKSEADALLALKADKATTYTKGEVDDLLLGKAAVGSSYTKTESDERYATPSDIPDVSGKADKATTYTKSEVDTALGGKQDTLTFDSAPTSGSGNPVTSGGVYTAVQAKASTSDIANYCPLIEDTRSSQVAAITGVAPFATLTDGQMIVLRLHYNSATASTLNLTLSGGTTTGAKSIKGARSTAFQNLDYNHALANTCLLLVYDGTNDYWVLCQKDMDTVYQTMTSEQIATGTETAGKVISAKTLRDNFYTESEVDTAVAAKADKVAVIDASTTDDPAAITQALSPNTFYEFGEVDSLTVTLTAGTAGQLAIYAFAFTAKSGSTTLTLPASVIGEAPTIAADTRYECSILDNVLLFSESDGSNT